MEVRIHAFPSRDRAFVAFAQEAWRGLLEPRTPEALQRALRARYPTAVVNVQEELARHGVDSVVWYAFRTAALGGDDETPTDRELESSPAWAVLDDERRFLEVSPELADIAELPIERMLGSRVEDFSNPDDPTIREDIARLWEEFKAGGALSSTLRFNYADGRPRELAYRIVADSDGSGRHRLTVRVVGP